MDHSRTRLESSTIPKASNEIDKISLDHIEGCIEVELSLLRLVSLSEVEI